MDVKKLADLAEETFKKKGSLDSLFQDIADNFYPERADFTITRNIGNDFASNLMTSFPVLCRRDLGNQFSSMLRPTAKQWFHVTRKFSKNDDDEDNESLQMMQSFEETMRRAMYDQKSMFTRAMKEGDHDFAAFGQCALSVEVVNHPINGQQLLYRCWHLRDMSWQENEFGQIGVVFRKWKPTAQMLSRLFAGKVHEKVNKLVEKTPFEQVEILHMVVDADMYEGDAKGRPRWSIWWDKTHQHLMEAKPIWGKHYIIPRWQMGGSQYAYSPAVVAALPDARLIQAMTFTLLEVGEKAANPPMIAIKDAIKSDISVYAGGITWADNEYDERTGEVLRPITQDFRGFNYGLQLAQDTRAMITEAFFLNKLKPFNPASDPTMTAFQAGQIVQEYIRNALPIFEPMEMENSAEICTETFGLMMRHGGFGSPLDWPKQMRDFQVDFRFESPLHDLIDQQKGQTWLQAKALIADAVAFDPSTAFVFDTKVALRDALNGIGVEAEWLHSEAEVDQMAQAQQKKQQVQEFMSIMEQGSKSTANLAGAQKDMADAQPAVV